VPGYVYLFPGYRWMQHRCKRSMQVEWLHFRMANPALDVQLGALPSECRWPIRGWKFWRPVWTQLPRLIDERPPHLVSKAHAMVLWMTSLLQERETNRKNPLFASLEPLRPALTYMEEHFAQNPQLPEIAREVHLSPKHFQRRFSQVLGIAPHEYLNRQRMHLAWTLLRHQGLSVREVAQRLNCSSQFYFSRAFKKFFNATPLDVRMGRTTSAP
jgi:AraC-like DNA-binding protein